MLKLMNSFLMLVILCDGLKSLNGEVLQCEFQDVGFVWGSMYTCHVSSLDNSKNDMVIKSHTGTHLANRNNNDVKAIRIRGTNTKYIPEGLGSLFSLTAFLVENSELIEIRSKDFQGMQNLEYLSLGVNKLTSVPSDTFSLLLKLKIIYLGSNQIKYIGSGAFDQLTNLNRVDLGGNICGNKNYDGISAITQLKEDIKANCLTSVEWMLIQMENKFINEIKVMKSERQQEHNEITNEVAKACKMNEELIQKIDESQKESKEMIQQLLNERQENIKLRAELSTAKEEQKKEQDDKIKVINKRDQLEKELTEAKETIDQKLPKMEQTIEDFYMEVMDLKIERHHQRETSIALRSKLMEANEQLATCEINERSLI